MLTQSPSQRREPLDAGSGAMGCQGCAIVLALLVPVLFPIAIGVWLYGRTAWTPDARRMLGIGFLAGGVVAALIGVIMLGMAVMLRAPAVPPGTPREVTSMEVLSDPAGLAANGLVAYQKQAYTSDVVFGEKNVVPDPLHVESDREQVRDALGLWYGQDARLSADGEDRGKIEPKRTKPDWDDTLTVKKGSKGVFQGMAHVELPIRASDLHRLLRVSSEMTVTFPYSEEGGFLVGSVMVRQSAKLFVVTPKEKKLAEELDAWRTRGDRRGQGLEYLGVAILFVGIGIAQERKGRLGG